MLSTKPAAAATYAQHECSYWFVGTSESSSLAFVEGHANARDLEVLLKLESRAMLLGRGLGCLIND